MSFTSWSERQRQMQISRPSTRFWTKRNTGEQSERTPLANSEPPDDRYLNRFVTDADLLDPANAPERDGNVEDVLVYGKPYTAEKETKGWGDLDKALRTAFSAKHAPEVVDAMLDQVQ